MRAEIASYFTLDNTVYVHASVHVYAHASVLFRLP